MWTLYKKELRSYFSSLTAYITIGIFLLVNSLAIWVIKDLSILNFGYADTSQLFDISPLLFIFLISALCMKTFAEEAKTGTIEILKTKPLTNWDIVLAKYFAVLTVVLFSILPTFIYIYSIYKLGSPVGNIDLGATTGSYIGLFLLASIYISVGLFSSVITDNQIVSFIISMSICFSLLYLFDFIGSISFLKGSDFSPSWLGINSHYRSISRGVLDSRDLIYFISTTSLFLFLTTKILKEKV